jgi:IS5 family transposase
LRSRLDAIIDMAHALGELWRTINWSFLQRRYGAVYDDQPGATGATPRVKLRPSLRASSS